MIQPITISKGPLVSRADHRHELAAAAATAGILAGIDAGHRIPTGDLVGSPCLRRSMVPSKPASLVGSTMANTFSCDDTELSTERYAVQFVRVEHHAIFRMNDGTGRIVQLSFDDDDDAEQIALVLEDLLNSGNARELVESLTGFFGDGCGSRESSDRGSELVQKAAEILDAIDDLCGKPKAK
jgi:hypothetical protein